MTSLALPDSWISARFNPRVQLCQSRMARPLFFLLCGGHLGILATQDLYGKVTRPFFPAPHKRKKAVLSGETMAMRAYAKLYRTYDYIFYLQYVQNQDNVNNNIDLYSQTLIYLLGELYRDRNLILPFSTDRLCSRAVVILIYSYKNTVQRVFVARCKYLRCCKNSQKLLTYFVSRAQQKFLRIQICLQISQMFAPRNKKTAIRYSTRTNFRGTYISLMSQIQHFRDFIFEDHRISAQYNIYATYY